MAPRPEGVPAPRPEGAPAPRPEGVPARRRLFVAVWPPPEVMDALAAIARPERKGLKWTTADQWHVTLRFLGSVEASVERSVRSALASVDWQAIGPTLLSAGPRAETLGRTIWAIPVEGATALAGAAAGAAAAALVESPSEARDRPFRGHVTLARAKTPAQLRGLEPSPFHATWTATEVTLVCSTLAPAGARYEIVDKWSLQQPPR